ncbi:hypothetical protein [Tenacibaculum sp. IB213877]|jgi:uncharacterized protein (UPF0248 family)|uniref:hypothetical protein n=1 Tax=Tenacibaculum sp. IB213877 TaxID=3097351 RepID=UPI002A5AA27C|nr:hypothetical protein [Tenacibaculum sp. IB213877]MDY0781110.1 hypothetical protein [Tenacibaculum sp. IB213877]
MTTDASFQMIAKEKIKFLHFPKQDVLSEKNDQVNRFLNLKRALSLGNLEREKVKILFADDSGIKKVETTIWGVTDKAVILKQSTIIPLERIISVA